VAVGGDGGGESIFASGARSGSNWTWSVSTVIGIRWFGWRESFERELPDFDLVRRGWCRYCGDSPTRYSPPVLSLITRGRGQTSAEIGGDSSGGGSLIGVNCPSATSCVAVGQDDASDGQAVYALGSKLWVNLVLVVRRPQCPTALVGGGFSMVVSCADVTTCVAVGFDDNSEAVTDALIVWCGCANECGRFRRQRSSGS